MNVTLIWIGLYIPEINSFIIRDKLAIGMLNSHNETFFISTLQDRIISNTVITEPKITLSNPQTVTSQPKQETPR